MIAHTDKLLYQTSLVQSQQQSAVNSKTIADSSNNNPGFNTKEINAMKFNRRRNNASISSNPHNSSKSLIHATVAKDKRQETNYNHNEDSLSDSDSE